MLTFHSLSPYHSGQGTGCTCFISFPEKRSVPARATESTPKRTIKKRFRFFIPASYRRITATVKGEYLRPAFLAYHARMQESRHSLDLASHRSAIQICLERIVDATA